jgi:hypothetical protein
MQKWMNKHKMSVSFERIKTVAKQDLHSDDWKDIINLIAVQRRNYRNGLVADDIYNHKRKIHKPMRYPQVPMN